MFSYTIDNINLETPNTVKDLGVWFDSTLCFSFNIHNSISSAMKMYGFVVRNSKDFANSATIMRIYVSFVRPKREYSALVWFPYHAGAIASLERVQRRFLKYISFRKDGFFPERGFSQSLLLERFSINSLQHRFKIQCVIFFQKLINAKYDCSAVLEKISFLADSRSVNARLKKNTFYLFMPRTDILKHSPLYNICNNANAAQCSIDLFSCSKIAVKTADI